MNRDIGNLFDIGMADSNDGRMTRRVRRGRLGEGEFLGVRAAMLDAFRASEIIETINLPAMMSTRAKLAMWPSCMRDHRLQ